MAALNISPWAGEPAKQSIAYYIARINEQRGSFRDITESALTAELARPSSSSSSPSTSQHNGTAHTDADAASSVTSDSDAADPIARRRDELAAAKETILRAVGQAAQEAALSRDFLSLLLTRDNTVGGRAQAAASISAPLKEHLPLGVYGRERVESSAVVPSEEQCRDARLQAGGLKLEALEKSADALIDAGKRLEGEMREEAKYWEEVLSVKEKGWTMCRMPRERRALGVRIGSLEAASGYKEKGLAKLRRVDGGRVELELAPDIARGRRLRVEVCYKGQMFASNMGDNGEAMDTDSIEEAIRGARDTLFDEELFHEVSREAGQLWNRGIKSTGRGISLPVESDIEVVLSMTNNDTNYNSSADVSADLKKRYKKWPAAFATALRILLSHGHRQVHNRRTAPPSPLTDRILQRPTHNILSPLLTRLQHQAAHSILTAFLQDIVRVLQLAKLEVMVEAAEDELNLQHLLNQKNGKPKRAFVETLVDKLSNPSPSTYVLTLPFTTAQIKVKFRTSPMGMEYRYEVANPPTDKNLARVPQVMNFQDQPELEETILHLVQLYLVDLIQTEVNPGTWTTDTPHTGQLYTSAKAGDNSTEYIQTILLRKQLHLVWRNTDIRGEDHESKWTVSIDSGDGVDLLEALRTVNATSPGGSGTQG